MHLEPLRLPVLLFDAIAHLAEDAVIFWALLTVWLLLIINLSSDSLEDGLRLVLITCIYVFEQMLELGLNILELVFERWIRYILLK